MISHRHFSSPQAYSFQYQINPQTISTLRSAIAHKLTNKATQFNRRSRKDVLVCLPEPFGSRPGTDFDLSAYRFVLAKRPRIADSRVSAFGAIYKSLDYDYAASNQFLKLRFQRSINLFRFLAFTAKTIAYRKKQFSKRNDLFLTFSWSQLIKSDEKPYLGPVMEKVLISGLGDLRAKKYRRHTSDTSKIEHCDTRCVNEKLSVIPSYCVIVSGY